MAVETPSAAGQTRWRDDTTMLRRAAMPVAMSSGLARAATASARAWHIRRIRASDAERLSAFYAALSCESRLTRFLGISPGIGRPLARSMSTADHEHREGFVAVVGEWIVGHLSLEPVSDGTEEVAVAVADAWQRRGIGRALFEEGLRWARQRGVRSIVATAYAWNTPVLRLLSSAPEASTTGDSLAGVVLVEIPLQSTMGRPAA